MRTALYCIACPGKVKYCEIESEYGNTKGRESLIFACIINEC